LIDVKALASHFNMFLRQKSILYLLFLHNGKLSVASHPVDLWPAQFTDPSPQIHTRRVLKDKTQEFPVYRPLANNALVTQST